MSSLLINGTAFHIPLADKSVHLICTSPPYFNLRRYDGISQWSGGDRFCDHIDEVAKAERERNRKGLTRNANESDGGKRSTLVQNGIDKAFQYNGVCGKCGAVNTDNQFGLEPTIALYIEHTMEVMDECWRVLRDDGIFFFNIGDSFAGSGKGGNPENSKWAGFMENKERERAAMPLPSKPTVGVKDKDMCLIPERIGIAAQERGWYVRSRIAWKKSNVMPSSVRDRPTVDFETIWLFTKSERYYWDWYAVREKSVTGKWDKMPPIGGIKAVGKNGNDTYSGNTPSSDGYRNMRSTWEINTKPYSGAHYAVFPPEIPERCILTSPERACEICGKGWERVVDVDWGDGNGKSYDANRPDGMMMMGRDRPSIKTERGWRPTCTCCPNTVFHLHCDKGIEKDHADCRDCRVSKSIILDPFVGSGTTVAKAIELGRIGIGMDLSYKYLVENAQKRIESVQPRMMGLE